MSEVKEPLVLDFRPEGAEGPGNRRRVPLLQALEMVNGGAIGRGLKWPERTCLFCGKIYRPGYKDQKYCCNNCCSRAASRARKDRKYEKGIKGGP